MLKDRHNTSDKETFFSSYFNIMFLETHYVILLIDLYTGHITKTYNRKEDLVLIYYINKNIINW